MSIKLFKTIDLYMQALLCLLSLLLLLFENYHFSFIHPYIIVGGWQLVSFLIHLFSTPTYLHQTRKIYGITILIVALLGLAALALLSIDIPFLVYYMIGLLIVSPILAGWYFIICFKEVKLLQQKALVHLK